MIAIGAMTCSYEEMKAKKEGVAVFILHILEDKLWYSKINTNFTYFF